MVMTLTTKEKFQTQMRRTICGRVSLLKWSIPPYNSKRRYAHNTGQWQILKKQS